MAVTVREDRGITVVELMGELDTTNTAELGQLFDRLLAEGRRRFVLDLQGVAFIDSAGLATLVRCFKRVRNGTGYVSLASLQPPVRRVLELTRLDRAFEVCTDAATAVQHLVGT